MTEIKISGIIEAAKETAKSRASVADLHPQGEVSAEGILQLIAKWGKVTENMSEKELSRLEIVHQYGGFKRAFDLLTRGYMLIGAPVGDNFSETREAVRDRTREQYGAVNVEEFLDDELIAPAGEFQDKIYGEVPKDRGDGMVVVGLACYAKVKDIDM